MKKGKKLFTRLPFFVLIFSAYPSLALLSTNIREVDAGAAFRPFLVSLIGTVIFIIVLRLFLKDWTRASFATSVLLVLFFSYGHIARILINRLGSEYDKIIEITLYLLIFAIGFFGIRWITRKTVKLNNWIAPLNAVVLVLILFPVIQIYNIGVNSKYPSNKQAPTPDAGNSISSSSSPAATTPVPQGNEYPDVYLIVLDGYARGDTLAAVGFDNSPFLDSLKEMGFYVAECSRSTYRATLLSMSSTLNLDYLWKAIPNEGPADTDATPLYDALVHSQVRNEFEQRGYTIVSFESGYQWDELTDADNYITMEDYPSKSQFSESSVTEFEYLFLRNTALFPFLENSSLAVQRYYKHYNRVMFQLDKLPEIASSIPGPKFVYAHIMAPHTPFIFFPDGSLNTDTHYYNLENGTPSNSALWTDGYFNSIEFLNSRMPGILNEIIKNSKNPPVIVLQGDHGYLIGERRYNNLMAFYFPNGGDKSLYSTITPVNTFRLISNLYFGTHLSLRNDVSINADFGRPYARKTVKPYPETCP